MEFTLGNIITNSFQRGLKYIVPVFVNAILWVLTIWIPYINVGTTIGMTIGVAAKMSRDEEIGMTEVFKPEYRKYMGEYFLVMGFMMAGIFAGFAFLYIPGIVISIAWMLAPLFVIDKGLTPIDAISRSNKITYGKKWTIFGAMFVLYLLGIIAVAIGSYIFGLIPGIGGFLTLIWVIAAMAGMTAILMAGVSIIYGELSKAA